MVHARGSVPTNTATLIGALAMAAGALVYLNDQVPKPRNLHVFLWPALVLMAVGAILAAAGAIGRSRRPRSTAERGLATTSLT